MASGHDPPIAPEGAPPTPVASRPPPRSGEADGDGRASADGDRPRDKAPGAKRRPQARLQAVETEPPVSDWASLFGDLTRAPHRPAADPVEWRVHDRTHLEFAIDYAIGAAPTTQVWECFFFVPESFRLHQGTYDKKDIYDDLGSYVRYAVPSTSFHELAAREGGAALSRLHASLLLAAGTADGSPEAAVATRRLRLFACLARASGLAAMREVEAQIDLATDAKGLAALQRSAAAFMASCAAVTGALRDVLDAAAPLALPPEVKVAARWIDEDVSLVVEALCATLGIGLEQRSGGEGPLHELGEAIAARAVIEARHRAARGYDSVGRASADARAIEHLEFRRHVLKRFTASALWLSLEVRNQAQWVVHTLYALAAAVAMAFALVATFQSATPTSENIYRYAVLVIIAYAIKDRLKAVLQNAFSNIIATRLPDRRWSIRDRERGVTVGKVLERSAFLPFREVPAAALERRRMTREHALEEAARPERVLWHQKTISIAPARVGDDGAGFTMLTEIFRLNVARWLDHTDDPNRQIVFASPDDARVYQATARRVYNINVVYRLASAGSDAPWHRLRVVVSRKGIERIEPIA